MPHKKYLERQIELHKNLVPAYEKRYGVPYSVFYSKKRNEYLINMFNNQSFDRVLDLGCGTGLTIKSLSTNFIEVYGLDLSMDMLNLRDNSDAAVKGFLRGDAERIPFKSGKFSHVVVKGMLHHLENYEDSLSEVNRILISGGEIIVSEPSKDAFLLRFSRKILYKLSSEFDESDEGFKQKELAESLKNTGFRVTKIQRFGFFGYLLAQFPDKISILSKLPFNIAITRFLIFIDKILVKIPLIKSLSFHVIILAQKI